MKFFKKNSYDIIKLYINQIGITIFAMIMYTAGGMINTGEDSGVSLPVRFGISVFSTLFFFVLIYMAAWDLGAKDNIRYESGKIPRDNFKGLKMSLFANSINFFLIGMILIFATVFILTEMEWASSVFGILDMTLRFSASMYIGIIQWAFSAVSLSPTVLHLIQACAFLVMAFISVLVTHWGYRFGLDERKLFSFKKSNRSSK